MTDRQIETIEKAESMLTSLYWDIKDNREDRAYAERLDTILGKLYSLKRRALDRK